MDAWENEPNYNESVFKNWNKKFWLKFVSWQYARKIFGYKLDAWHLAKSCMIICFSFAMWYYKQANGLIVHLIIFGALWIFSFYLFYHRLFKVK